MSFNEKETTGVNVLEGGQHDLKNLDLDAMSNRDEIELAAQGKKQVLRRNFSLLNILGLALSCTITWEGMLVVFVYGLVDGGPAGLVWGFVFCWLGYLAINASLAEMASMYPTAGGQYHWVYMLAPEKLKRFLSYVVGWQTVIAWQAGTASAAYLGGTIIQALIIINYPDYDFQRWHGTLLVYMIMAICVFFNTILGKFLPQVEYLILFLHCAGFFGILIPMVHFAPHGSAHDVFVEFLELGGYDSEGLTFLVGIVAATFAFIGADGPVHMCEEIAGASRIVPWTMIAAILINGALGFSMVIAVLFCIGDITALFDSPVTAAGYPFLAIFYNAVQSIKGATAMGSFVVTLVIFACISFFAPTSRMTWSFARDRGLPGSSFIGHVDPKTKLPLWSIGLTALVTLLLALINIGSSVAFNAIVSLVVAGFLGSYMLPVGLLLWRRIAHPETLVMGPWTMGKLAIPVNIFGLSWTIIAFIFSFFPYSIVGGITPVTMNWACLLYGGTTIFFLFFYLAFGRFTYKGPIIETTVMEQLS